MGISFSYWLGGNYGLGNDQGPGNHIQPQIQLSSTSAKSVVPLTWVLEVAHNIRKKKRNPRWHQLHMTMWTYFTLLSLRTRSWRIFQKAGFLKQKLKTALGPQDSSCSAAQSYLAQQEILLPETPIHCLYTQQKRQIRLFDMSGYNVHLSQTGHVEVWEKDVLLSRHWHPISQLQLRNPSLAITTKQRHLRRTFYSSPAERRRSGEGLRCWWAGPPSPSTTPCLCKTTKQSPWWTIKECSLFTLTC